MAESLSPACTPLRRTYDICFNRWLEGYMDIAAPRPGSSTKPLEGAAKKEELQRQAQLYEDKCGAAFREYQECLQKGIQEVGIGELLEAARTEEPLIVHSETKFPGFGR